MRLEAALKSEAGGRKYNEDFCSYKEKDGFACFLLADGLGGHRGGGLAAVMAGESILEAFEASPGASVNKIKEYLEKAQKVFLLAQENNKDYASFVTTLVVMLSDITQAVWAHIGDSRLYYFHRGRINFQTKDHSVPQRLADAGEIHVDHIRLHEDRNRLTRAFNGKRLDRFEYTEMPVEINADDAFLLCSDGFWEYVYEPEMEKDLARADNPGLWLSLMEKRLLSRIPSNTDNYSAVTVMIK